jgi:tryptophanase
LDYVIDAAARIYEKRESLRGYRIIYEPRYLRHFLAEVETV